jgi:hypothetical protein
MSKFVSSRMADILSNALRAVLIGEMCGVVCDEESEIALLTGHGKEKQLLKSV